MNPSRIAFLLFLLFPCCVGCWTCQPSGTQARQPVASFLPDKDSLMQAFRQQRQLAIILPHQSEQAEALRVWATNMAENSRYRDIVILNDDALTDSLAANTPLVLVGAHGSNRWLDSLGEGFPLRFSQDGFTFQNDSYDEPNHSLLLSWYPSPANPSMPLSVLTANSDTALLRLLTSEDRGRRMLFGWGSWDFQVFEGSEKRLIGNYADDWQADPDTRWTFSPEGKPDAASPVAEVFLHGEANKELVDDLLDSLSARQQRWVAFSESDRQIPPLDYHLWLHPEDMGLETGIMETGFLDGRAVHRVVHPEFIDKDPGMEWAFWMQQTLGDPSRQILQDGLRVFLTPDFQQLGYRSLAASLIRAEGKVPANILFDPAAYERESPLVRDCYAGAVVEFLVDYWGRDTLFAHYQALNDTEPDADFVAAWDEFQARLLSETPKRAGFSTTPDYYKGMTFAHEGYQVYNGYGSRLSEKALDHLSAIGCNAVAIVPYTGTSNPQSKEPLRWSRSAGSENDASVMLAHYGAKEAGMLTMLKPQVWVRGGWPGDVDMPKEEDWEVWFDHYHRWIRHYAVMAEIHQMDILCLGTEFRYATLKHPDSWRDLVMKIRQIYHGTITYAANWGEEVENLGFADVLDFVGVNCYYPLANGQTATQEELNRSMEKTLSMLDKLSQKWEIPYVLTEIGYRSINAPWEHPHADAGEARANDAHQAMCYRAVLGALPDHPSCRGLFWWKWPSYERYAHRNPRSFTPCGKEAERVMAEAYQAW